LRAHEELFSPQARAGDIDLATRWASAQPQAPKTN
jgi:hypothetical protein